MRFTFYFNLLVLLSFCPPGLAQVPGEQTPANRLRQLNQSVQREATCVGELANRLERVEVLLAEAERQRSQAEGEQDLVDAAEQTIAALWLRARAIATAVEGCRETHLQGERVAYDADGNPLVTRDAPRDEGADRVGQEGNSLATIDEGSHIAGLVWVVRGEHVDGEGTLAPEIIRSRVHALGQPLDACFREFSTRTGSPEARLSLSFSSLRQGRITQVELESQLPQDRRFGTCVRRAFSRIPRLPAFSGSTMIWSYHLAFGTAGSTNERAGSGRP